MTVLSPRPAAPPGRAASARGLSPASTLDRLRAEIRYRIELCPCTGVDDDYVELAVER